MGVSYYKYILGLVVVVMGTLLVVMVSVVKLS